MVPIIWLQKMKTIIKLVMKNLFKLFLFLTILVNAVSCDDYNDSHQVEPDPVLSYYQLSGTWRLDKWNGETQDDVTYVYVKLNSKEQTFAIYSNIDSYYPVVRTGHFDLEYDYDNEYNVISGFYDYSFGFFQYDYKVNKVDDDTMIWTAIGAEDVCVYRRASLPEGME